MVSDRNTAFSRKMRISQLRFLSASSLHISAAVPLLVQNSRVFQPKSRLPTKPSEPLIAYNMSRTKSSRPAAAVEESATLHHQDQPPKQDFSDFDNPSTVGNYHTIP